ncbi:hypothetical protein [Desulfoferrobacter suflitae]|uniref:hypothetical protein n=1 Tax=Desulfoferrobacter suflitae TaxID=2865782 RepID=UPI00216457D6|nr:hypothetical protein [Desulfoferrobacter suflitae]MCK8603837.1 hypothetical protein [Desulfoferrobacter suflitae]
MKDFFVALLLIVLMGCLTSCATGDAGRGEEGPQVKYGGTMNTRIRSSHGM